MSALRTRKHRHTRNTLARIWDRLSGNPRRTSGGYNKPRRLTIDPLEERQLLSVSPATVDDVLIDQVTDGAQSMLYGKSVATNSNGDFVAVWTRTDLVEGIDPATGQPWKDQATGLRMTDQNVYARYYTDAVQRITLPSVGGTFAIKYNGNEVQKLTISAGTTPFEPVSSQNNEMVGSFVLRYTNPTTQVATTVTVNYDQAGSLAGNAAEIQDKLRGLDAAFGDVMVEAIDARNYLIHFGNDSVGQPQSDVDLVSFITVDSLGLTGFLPAVELSVVRQAGTTQDILVSANPSATAASIEYALLYTSQDFDTAPIEFPPRESVNAVIGSPVGPYLVPNSIRTGMPEVRVTARSATEFDIEFIGDSGKEQQPLMEVIDRATDNVMNGAVKIIKQSSDEFRVNAAEPDDPDTLRPDFYNQYNAQVAMDADGDFVITWESVVPNSANPGSVTDVFARRFSPSGYKQEVVSQDIVFTPTAAGAFTGTFQLVTGRGVTSSLMYNSADLPAVVDRVHQALLGLGYDPAAFSVSAPGGNVLRVTWNGWDTSISLLTCKLSSGLQAKATVRVTTVASNTVPFLADMNHDGVAETYVQGVTPLGSGGEFQVNTITANPQETPSVAMDHAGNFTIVWASGGQNLGFFNNIQGQRYDRDGNRLGSEFTVSTLTDNTSVNFAPYVAMGNDGVIGVTWTNSNDLNYYLTGSLAGTLYAKVYDAQGVMLLEQFSFGGGGLSSIAFDSGDNFVVSWELLEAHDNIYTGNAENIHAAEYQLYDAQGAVSGAVIRPEFRVNSADFSTTATTLWPWDQYFSQVMIDADGDLTIAYEGFGPEVTEFDIDQYIEDQLIQAKADGTPDFGLGLLRAQLEREWGLLRGAANDIMFSQFDADPHTGQAAATILTSDDVANNHRDGQNSRYLLDIDPDVVSGSINLRVGNQTVSITPVFYADGGPINPFETLDVIHDKLSALTNTGVNWPEDLARDAPFEGGVFVRLVSVPVYDDVTATYAPDPNGEMTMRLGTGWDPSNAGISPGFVVYEITFLGELHDTEISLTLAPGTNLKKQLPAVNETVQVVVDSLVTDGSDNATANFTIEDADGNPQPITLTLKNEIQQIKVTNPTPGAAASGTVRLSVDVINLGGATTTITTTLTFNGTTTLAQIAQSIQDWLSPSFPGVVVTVDPASTLTSATYSFTVTFRGQSELRNPGQILAAASSTLTTNIITTQQGSGIVRPGAGSLARVAQALQGQLEGVGFPGVTVEVDPDALIGDPQYTFTIVFGGDSGGIDQPELVYDAASTLIARVNVLLEGEEEGETIDAPSPVIAQETYGNAGTTQTTASIAMSRDGDFVMVWAEYALNNSGGYSTTNFYFRTFEESSDTAGPLVTDFLLPTETGGRLKNNETVNDPLQYMIVSFDEDMMTTGANSVTNVANWALMKDGAQVTGGISAIYYGMNEGATRTGAPASNKWEVVLVLDGNGNSAGNPTLANGHYQIVAKNSLRDKAGNALGRTGYEPNGAVFARDFNVSVHYGPDTRVNAVIPGEQVTATPNASSTASNANGDYIVVWTDAAGVYAKIYDANWGKDATGARVSNPTVRTVVNPITGLAWANNEIVVAVNSGAVTDISSATVACDALGNFVVTWSQQDAGDWNVWGKRFDAQGKPQDHINLAGTNVGPTFMVNTTVLDEQSHSAVAMDSDGDFVITWQSLNQAVSDAGDYVGYDIYAQRFDSDGLAIGGTDEYDVLTLTGRPKGTFTLEWQGQITGPISCTGGAFTVVNAVKAALENLWVDPTDHSLGKVRVAVSAISSTEIAIQFTGVVSSMDVEPLTIHDASITGDPGVQIGVETRADGKAGEFLVNTTTFNDQMAPAIAMDASGAFVISWTSYGQDADMAYRSNIYAKQFVASDDLRTTNTNIVRKESLSTSKIPGAVIEPLVVTTDDPANHVVAPGSGLDGVVELIVTRSDGIALGSGTLLADGRHILTAAHMVCDDLGNMVTTTIDIVFGLATGNLTLTVSAAGIFVNPQYTGDPTVSGGDLAILELPELAPVEVERHDILRQNTAVGQVFTMVGYGLTGTGDVGEIGPAGIKHSGQNKYEGTSSLLVGFYPDALISDFDSGTAANDAFGQLFGINDLGVGINEASTARGDSGGPNFVNGLIAGVTSYGLSIPGDWDVLAGINSSYGDISADVNVALYAEWIDSITGSGGGPELLVNAFTDGDQKWSSVAMDAAGDFVISWTSYGQDGVGDGPGAGVNGLNGVYAQRYDSDGAKVGVEFLVNTFRANDQQYSRVAMDAAGDFTIVWESYQDRPSPGQGLPDAANSFGIYGQSYVRNSLVGTNPLYGVNGEFESEFAINNTKDGAQRSPSIAMDDAGDFVVVWSGYGSNPVQGIDVQGVYLQRFDRVSDTAGPRAIETFNLVNSTTRQEVPENGLLTSAVTKFVVTFSEDMSSVGGATGTHSILNPANWSLSLNGATIFRGVTSVSFVDPAKPREVVVTFDAEPNTSGIQSLGSGVYVLTAREAIQDIRGNALDGNVDGLPGGSFSRRFSIAIAGAPAVIPDPGAPPPGSVDPPISSEFGISDSPVVASNTAGDYVCVWVSSGQIVGQRYNSLGQTRGGQFNVNSNTYTFGLQTDPDVAMDSYGNFVVTWSGWDLDSLLTGVARMSVFARMYDSFGAAIGTEFRVAPTLTTVQQQSSVAMNQVGDFVITWTRYNQVGDKNGVIYGRHYDSYGQPVGGEFLVGSLAGQSYEYSDVAMADNGNLIVTWQSFTATTNNWDIYAQRLNAAGGRLGGAFRVNDITANMQIGPRVSMDAAGDFVVAWQSFVQDLSEYGVYARRYNAAGAALDTGEFRVNQTTLNRQYQPDVAMDRSGNFTVVWTTFGQDDILIKDYGVYARMYRADGSTAVGEFRINATTRGDQVTPAVTRNAANGSAFVVWVGPSTFGTAIYARMLGGPAGTSTSTTNNNSSTTTNNQPASISATVGLYNVATSTFYLKDSNATGVADDIFAYGSSKIGWITIVGDWNGDGVDTIGLYNPTTSVFSLKNSNASGWADVNFSFGTAKAGWKPIAGDWNGDGKDTVGLYNATTSTFYLRNSNTSGKADVTFVYGTAKAGWKPIAGDWNGDGKDTIGLYNPTTSVFSLKNSNASGNADATFTYGTAKSGWTPIAGDWNNDGKDTVGLYNPTTSTFYLRNTNNAGVADFTFTYGTPQSGWTPIVGAWNGSGQALVAAGAQTTASANASALTKADLQPIINEAIARWAAAGLDAVTIAKLTKVQFVISDLPGSYLGRAEADRIYLDRNAAGYGWFVDSTPTQNEEYAASGSNGQLRAVDSRAVDRIDLLTVIEHELGHIAGLGDLNALTDHVMSGQLGAGTRRDYIDAAFAAN